MCSYHELINGAKGINSHELLMSNMRKCALGKLNRLPNLCQKANDEGAAFDKGVADEKTVANDLNAAFDEVLRDTLF